MSKFQRRFINDTTDTTQPISSEPASSASSFGSAPLQNSTNLLATQWLSKPIPVSAFCINPSLIKLTDDPSHPLYLPDRPLPGSAQEAAEVQELTELERQRDDETALQPHAQAGRERRGLSPYLTDVACGQALAERFADESPEGIFRGVLNGLMTHMAHVRWGLETKAQLRMVLDATMYNARLIAWHYKWRSTRGISVTYRPRPTEIAPEINVLYHADSPSYPSAHSTIAGAASHLLTHCFAQQQTNLDDLADNVGMSCLWAGVNYRSDHINGLRLGRAVAAMLLQQMGKS